MKKSIIPAKETSVPERQQLMSGFQTNHPDLYICPHYYWKGADVTLKVVFNAEYDSEL